MDRLQDRERLMHMLKSVEKIMSYTEGLDLADFEENEMLQDAVFKNLEIIGEAAYKLSKEFKNKYGHLQWRRIEGLRHKLVHDDYQVDLRIVWETKDKSLPRLLNAVEHILRSLK